jgi:membrane protein
VTTPSAPARRARKLLRSGGERVLTIVLSLAVAVAGLSAFYKFSVTHPRRVRRRLVPGAVVALALWIVVSWAFSLYLRTLASYTVYYGSLAAVAVLLVWLWLISLAILVGAELNAQLEGLRDELD